MITCPHYVCVLALQQRVPSIFCTLPPWTQLSNACPTHVAITFLCPTFLCPTLGSYPMPHPHRALPTHTVASLLAGAPLPLGHC